MVMACCAHCYEKYMDDKKNVDTSFVKRVYGEEYTTIKLIDDAPETVAWYKQFNQEPPEKVYALKGDEIADICNCSCHIKGLNICH